MLELTTPYTTLPSVQLQQVFAQARTMTDVGQALVPPFHRLMLEMTKVLKPKCRICPHEHSATIRTYCKHKGKCHYKSARNALVAALKANDKCALLFQAYDEASKQFEQMDGESAQ